MAERRNSASFFPPVLAVVGRARNCSLSGVLHPLRGLSPLSAVRGTHNLQESPGNALHCSPSTLLTGSPALGRGAGAVPEAAVGVAGPQRACSAVGVERWGGVGRGGRPPRAGGGVRRSDQLLLYPEGQVACSACVHSPIHLCGLDHMKVYTCGKKFPPTFSNRSMPVKSMTKANHPPKYGECLSL